MAQPIKADLKCYRGQTFRQNIYFKRGGVPIDLTGVTAKAQIRPSENSNILTAEFECAVEGERGRITLILSADKTAGIKAGTYLYDLKVTDGEGIVGYWVKGKFAVNGRVTV